MKTFFPLPDESTVLEKLITWGNADPSICALILTSSRARPDGPVDQLSDYDLIVMTTDAERFVRDEAWQSDYGQPMVRWGDQSEELGRTTYFRSVIYTDGVKVDYSFWPDALLEKIAEQPDLLPELDTGYRIVLDKDGRTAGWKQPSYRGYVPAKPTEAEYLAQVEEFWWVTTYVAKSLWRDELVFAKWCMEQELRIELLRRQLEWQLETRHDWRLRPGVLGRGLKRLLPEDTWSELLATYAGTRIEDNWIALFRLTALFRRVAQEVAAALGYTYPQPIDDQVSAYLNAIHALPAPDAQSTG